MGIVKVDLLGLGMLAAIDECLARVRESYGEEVDLAHLPPDDPAVYAALEKADTVGMFQVESRAQMACLPRLRPRRFYDLVVQVALIRPGPIVGKMVHPYLQRRQGREPVDSMHPSLEPVLSRTLGVPLFQEQLLRMAMIAASFSGGAAEELRRAFGFKRSEKRMRDLEGRLREGMQRNGITGAVQDRIIQAISSFALYGFPESHAASFALIAYASAYLKCHYLAAFTCAMLNHQPMGFYHPAILVKDAQRHGLRVLPVDITKSDWPCRLENTTPTPDPQPPTPALRLGFKYVRGLREEAARAIIRARPFSSIDELALRVPELRKDELHMLAEVGALNPLRKIHRREALWQSARAARPVGPLLEHLEETEAASPLAVMNAGERLSADYRGTGVNIGRHLMAHRREEMRALGVTPAAALRDMRNGRVVRVAGAVIVRQRPGTAKGFVFLSMEDETGILNVIVTPPLFDRYRLELLGAPLLLIDGTLQNVDHVVSVKAGRIAALPATTAVPASHDFH
jgi:error-prone DNA polymerase